MKTAQYELPYGIFGGVFGVVADSLGKSRYFLPAESAAPASGPELPPEAAPAPAALGLAARIGRWFMRRQVSGVAPTIARSKDVFVRLDQWMWRQHTREIESYLAKSNDVFDLERRIAALDRSPGFWTP
jgi:hypothetical protein